MRIGDVLLNAGLVTEEQLEEGLRAQVMWGGRLGTNLVELGYLQLDELSRALGLQHDMPAALDAHFTRADRELQDKLAAELAEKYQCVPLVRAGKRIVIASSAPLDDKAVALVAGQLDINRHMIVQSVAAETCIRRQLEKVYGIPRGQRLSRARVATPVARLALGSTPLPKIDLAVIADSLPEALADIELARDREELARRLIGTVARFVPESQSALLLMIRGEAAVSTTSFRRSGVEPPPLAVPLGQPGLVSAATRRKNVCRGASGDLQPFDYLLLEWLGVQFGDLVVAPISIAEKVIGTVVLATEHRAALASLAVITSAASLAFARLMPDAASN